MSMLAVILAAILVVLAALHAYWGLGGLWPGTDEVSCARAVVGFRGVKEMPPSASAFAVAACLVIAAVWALALGNLMTLPLSGTPVALVGLLIALVFLGRGIAGFAPAWRRLACEQPFASLDVRYYSPLCIAIGLGLALLSIREFSA